MPITAVIDILVFVLVWRISGLQQFEPSWTVFGLMTTSLVAYFTLLNNLGDSLKNLGDTVKGEVASERIATISNLAVILRTLTVMSVVLLLAYVCRFFADIGLEPSIFSFGSVFLILLTAWTPFSLLFLALSGYRTGTMIFRYKRDDAVSACHRYDAAVHLKNGRILKGCMYDLSFLKTPSVHLALCREDFSHDVVALSDVAAIFLQQEYSNHEVLSSAVFTEERRSLKLTFPHEESLPAVRHFNANGFTVLELDKPTTSARFAIVDELFLEPEW